MHATQKGQVCCPRQSLGSGQENGLADELAYRAAHLHRLMHRIAEHLVNGQDGEPRSLALVEVLRARHGLKHDEVDETDAIFMVGACAAFVSYLINKSRTAPVYKG